MRATTVAVTAGMPASTKRTVDFAVMVIFTG